MSEKIAIALDGPAGCGKSTVAKALAEKLGIYHLDTGAMYRGIAYIADRDGLTLSETPEFLDRLDRMALEYRLVDGKVHFLVNRTDVMPYIRDPKIAALSSQAARIPQVRDRLVKRQKGFAREHDVVMDGRDIGTKVLTHTPYKFFLTADLDERAQRRHAELPDCSLEEIKAQIVARDQQDEDRAHSPLVQAKDAVLIDTTHMTIQQVVDQILQVVNQ